MTSDRPLTDRPEGAISTAVHMICDCCGKARMCAMYILQMGETAWICLPCREGKKE